MQRLCTSNYLAMVIYDENHLLTLFNYYQKQ